MKKPTDRYNLRAYYSRARLKKHPGLWDALYEEIEAADELRAYLKELHKELHEEHGQHQHWLEVYRDQEKRRAKRRYKWMAKAREQRNKRRKTRSDECRQFCRRLALDFLNHDQKIKPTIVIKKIQEVMQTKSNEWKRKDPTIHGYIINLFHDHRRPRKKNSPS